MCNLGEWYKGSISHKFELYLNKALRFQGSLRGPGIMVKQAWSKTGKTDKLYIAMTATCMVMWNFNKYPKHIWVNYTTLAEFFI